MKTKDEIKEKAQISINARYPDGRNNPRTIYHGYYLTGFQDGYKMAQEDQFQDWMNKNNWKKDEKVDLYYQEGKPPEPPYTRNEVFNQFISEK